MLHAAASIFGRRGAIQVIGPPKRLCSSNHELNGGFVGVLVSGQGPWYAVPARPWMPAVGAVEGDRPWAMPRPARRTILYRVAVAWAFFPPAPRRMTHQG